MTISYQIASTFQECHEYIHEYYSLNKKICQGGYLWDIEENNQICKTSLCSKDYRFASEHQAIQLWQVNYDKSGPENLIPSSSYPSFRNYSSSELWGVEYHLEFPFNYTKLLLSISSINDASIYIMKRKSTDQTILNFLYLITNVGSTNFELTELFSSVVLFYVPKGTNSSVSFSLSWSNQTKVNIGYISYLMYICHAIGYIILILISILLYFDSKYSWINLSILYFAIKFNKLSSKFIETEQSRKELRNVENCDRRNEIITRNKRVTHILILNITLNI